MDSTPVQKNSEAKGSRDWPHAPPHRLQTGGVYFVTARAAERRALLADDAMKDWFQGTLLELAKEFGWRLEAWAVLANHYHFIAHSPEGAAEGAESLRSWVRKLHSLTTKELNRRENQPGRTRLWQNYRETQLTHAHSYLARLNYVHHNAVHHGLVRSGVDWPWCSARAFQAAVTPAWYSTVTSFRYEDIAARDADSG
jgi:putative transposase